MKALGVYAASQITDYAVHVDASRCLRMRFNRSRCSRCVDECRAGAITLRDGLHLNGKACTGCMLCVSACPSGCFEIAGLDFLLMAARMQKITTPVLGCAGKECLAAHERTCCLGFLSEEHLLALSVLVHQPVQLNMIGCRGCRNGFTAIHLKRKMEQFEARTGVIISDSVQLVQDASELVYVDIAYDRRGFFAAVKDHAVQHASLLLGKEHPGKGSQAYSRKEVPFRRRLLNRSLSFMDEGGRRSVQEHYYFHAVVDATCTSCHGCAGMCPTGALQAAKEGPEGGLLFNSAFCAGCGLCEQFCESGSLHIERGCFEEQPLRSFPIRKAAVSAQ